MGFIGLGVMGEPICANIAGGGFGPMTVLDLNAEPVARLVAGGANEAKSIADLSAAAEVIFLSLPGGPEVEKIVLGPGGLLESGRAGQVIVDLSTCPVNLTRTIHDRLADAGIGFADAPVARTRQAAITTELIEIVSGAQALGE